MPHVRASTGTLKGEQAQNLGRPTKVLRGAIAACAIVWRKHPAAMCWCRPVARIMQRMQWFNLRYVGVHHTHRNVPTITRASVVQANIAPPIDALVPRVRAAIARVVAAAVLLFAAHKSCRTLG